MATGKRYYWMKLKEDFFDEDTIQFIEEQENGVAYVNFYLKLCLKSLKNEGKLIRIVGETLIPYDAKSLAKLTNTDYDTVCTAMQLFERIGLVSFLESGEIFLSQISELAGSETDKAMIMREKRAKEKLDVDNVHSNVHTLSGDNVPTNVPTVCKNSYKKSTPNENGNNVTTMLPQCSHNVTQSIEYRDKSIEFKDKSIDGVQMNNICTAESRTCPFKKIMELYLTTCKSFSKIKGIDGERKKAVSARWSKYQDLQTFQELFEIAESSSFLKGENNRNWKADFDWMMKATNFIKILEHKYDDKEEAPKQTEGYSSSFDTDEFFQNALRKSYE